ncbi:Presenilin-like protein [Nymphaea thermarum]|nr:Presenilin-like protein [Nymphaea thermarum]
MEVSPSSRSVLDGLGEEIIRIVYPVSICMLLVVVLVSVLNSSSPPSSSSSWSSIATLVYNETTTESLWDAIKGAILNALAFVLVVTIATFLLVLLFYFRCTKLLKFYMGFCAFMVLGLLGGEILILLIEHFNFPIDCITFCIILFNFTVVGVMSVFMFKMPIFITQSYLVVIGMLVAYWFTMLPEWTTWAMLVAMSLYDLAAVLLPVGPLRLLVELAIARDEDIPALVYEARPVNGEGSAELFIRGDHQDHPPGAERMERRRVWKQREHVDNGSSSTVADFLSVGAAENSSELSQRLLSSNEPDEERRPETRIVIGDARISGGGSAVNSSPRNELSRETVANDLESRALNALPGGEDEGIGLGSSGAIKLGLGDFVFYSVLVGRAAMYDLMTVYACYLAIMAGLGVTLILLAFYKKALPALPVSILLGIAFYFLTRFLLEAFVFECSSNLILF